MQIRPFRGLNAVVEGVSKALLYLATSALLLMTFLVVLSACMRYLVGRPFGFTEELVALLYMAMVFLSIPLATVRRKHIAISVLPARVMHLYKYPLRLAAGLAMIVFCVWFAAASYSFTAESHRFGSITEQSSIVLWPWMAIIPLCMGFVAVISMLHLAADAREEPPAEPDHSLTAGDSL